MNIKDIRVLNTLALANEVGSITRLAELVDTPQSYLSQCTTGNRTRGIGDRLARRLENVTGRASGWLDMVHDPSLIHEQRTRYPLLDINEIPKWLSDMDIEYKTVAFGTGEENYGPKSFSVVIKTDAMVNRADYYSSSFGTGDYVLIDPDIQPHHQDMVIIQLGKDSTDIRFRQYLEDGKDKILVASDEKILPIKVSDDVKFLGVIVAVQKRINTRH